MDAELLKRSLSEAIATALSTAIDASVAAEAAAEEARAAFLAKRGKQGKTPAAGERSAQDKAAIAGLRAACGKRGLKDEFDALETSGASMAELRGVLAAGLRTNGTEVDGSAAPATGKRGKLVRFDETSRGKAAK